MFRLNSISILLSCLTILLPVAGFAATPSQELPQTFNGVLIGLISLIVVLLFVIGLLGTVVKSLAGVYRDKIRKEKNASVTKAILLLLVFSITSLAVSAQETTSAVAPSANAAISGISNSDFYMMTGIIGLELLVIFSLLLTMRLLVRILSNKPETQKAAAAIMRKPFWDRFNKAVAIEKEQDILLDHNYDGIQELDNSLPPWWKYGFYLTIVISVVYMYYYHVGSGPDSYQEYVAEVEQGEKEKALYLAKSANNVDENTVTMLDAQGIASGEVIFQNMCAACHAKDGGGGVGPNLADDYWMHGGSLQDVFKSIKYGWPDKGMKSWKDDFSPKQLAELTSYIKSLKGTQPAAPKEKQGELYVEGDAVAQDSVKTVVVN